MKQYNSLKKKESSPLDINKTNDYSDRGVELILSGGKRKLKKSFEIYFQKVLVLLNRKITINFEFSLDIKKGLINFGGIMTLETVLVLVLPISFLLFSAGIIAGWLARDYMMNYREVPRPHPEMLDQNGNLVPDEIIAFRFENYDYDEEDNN